MAMIVPFPFRVAAGIVATGLDRLRTLPEDLPALTVSLAGHAVRASMRVQQEIAQLAARGEEMLAPLTDRPEEHPPWAHFDDDDDYLVDAAVDVVDSDSDAEIDAEADPGAESADADADAVTYAEQVPRASVVRLAAVIDTGDGPAEIPEYDDLRVSQLRARLGDMDEDAVAALLAYERSSRARAAFLTTLENRLTSLQSQSRPTTRHRSGS